MIGVSSSTGTTMNFLTKGYADSLYCSASDCGASGNITGISCSETQIAKVINGTWTCSYVDRLINNTNSTIFVNSNGTIIYDAYV